MSIEQIIEVWKDDEERIDIDTNLPMNPVGEELSEKELLEVSGGLGCLPTLSCINGLTREG